MPVLEGISALASGRGVCWGHHSTQGETHVCAPSGFVGRVVGMLMITMFADLESLTPLPRIALYRTATREWVFDSDAGSPRPAFECFGAETPWVAVMGSDVFLVESQTVPHLLVELVSRLQRYVLDSTGAEWPEVYRNGQLAGFAIPTVGSHSRQENVEADRPITRARGSAIHASVVGK